MTRPPGRRLLVIDRGGRTGDPAGQQVHGFDMYGPDLARGLGLSVERVTALTLPDVAAAYERRRTGVDDVLFMVNWAEPVEAVTDLVRRMAEPIDRPKLLFLDYYAQTSSPHFAVLPHVDRYIKRQVLRDRDLYQQEPYGGFVFTDYLHRRMGYRLDGWHFGSVPDATEVHKLVVGWNLGVTGRYRRLLRLTRPLARLWRCRPLAVNRRFSLPDAGRNEWYHQYRQAAQQELSALAEQVRCTGLARLSPRRYLAELIASKLVVSPFGWGEVCFRDYEAVAAGALLVKPDMGHLVTNPDIYRPGETYVPVRWDLSDLADTCRYYLSRPAEASRIARAAQDALYSYFEGGGFVADVARVIEPAARRVVAGDQRQSHV